MSRSTHLFLSLAFLCLASCNVARHDSAEPVAPSPPRPHTFLMPFIGEWETESEVVPGPFTHPTVMRGTEKVRALGQWIVSEGEVPLEGELFRVILTLGYDESRQRFAGTWVDSMQGYLWIYEGRLDPSGKRLTLETEGPSIIDPGKRTRYREILEWKSADHRVHSAYIQDGAGWDPIARVHSRRRSP